MRFQPDLDLGPGLCSADSVCAMSGSWWVHEAGAGWMKYNIFSGVQQHTSAHSSRVMWHPNNVNDLERESLW